MNDSDIITYVGHGTVLIEVEGTRLLTDPVLRRRIGPLVRHGPAPAPGIVAGIDAVLVSHLHHDHADLGSLRLLDRETPLLVPPGSQEFFAHHGFASTGELAPGQSARVGALTVEAIEAHHTGGRRRFAKEAQAIGFLVDGRRRAYFAGDTDFFPGMDSLGPIDLALLPIWGWGPTIGAGHLDPAGAARAAAAISPRLAVPIHWGTLYPFGLSRFRGDRLRLPGEEFATYMRELAPHVETRVLSPGESTSLA